MKFDQVSDVKDCHSHGELLTVFQGDFNPYEDEFLLMVAHIICVPIMNLCLKVLS